VGHLRDRRRRRGPAPHGDLPRDAAGRLKLSHALIGGIVAGLLWEITRHVIVWYFATLSQIILIYGSFATTIALLLSFEIAAIVLLLGAQVIAIYERRLRRAEGRAGRCPVTFTEACGSGFSLTLLDRRRTSG
jgi:hypothetical protein